MLEKCIHIKPTSCYERQAKEFISEFRTYNSEICGVGGLDKYIDDYAAWLKKLDESSNRDVSEKKVPSYTFFLVRCADNKIVGMISIRPFLNSTLQHVGGTMGYCIRPTERSKGYNKYNLFLGIKYCAGLGVSKVYIDCDANNIASAKTAKALGGQLVKRFYDSSTFNCMVEKYIIDVFDSIKRFSSEYLC